MNTIDVTRYKHAVSIDCPQCHAAKNTACLENDATQQMLVLSPEEGYPAGLPEKAIVHAARLDAYDANPPVERKTPITIEHGDRLQTLNQEAGVDDSKQESNS